MLTSTQPTDKPFVLSCQYCMWTSLDCGISFASGSNIRQQVEGKERDGKDNRSSVSRPKLNPLDQYNPGRGGSSSLANEYTKFNDDGKQSDEDKSQTSKVPDPHARFNALKSFYKEQLLASDSSQTASSLDALSSSPASLTRLMSLYNTNTSSVLGRKAKQKSTVMREALTPNEGLHLTSSQSQPSATRPSDYTSTPTPVQLANQYPYPLGNPSATQTSQLKPMPTPLRTKRSKRCATCKHILVKPELKVTSTRYRIKLIALNYIPFVSLKPVPISGGLLPAGIDGDPKVKLSPARPSQWILTLRNPLFENVTVSLGSPSVTPGRHGHKVTILCPEFTIGKNGDVWDDATLTAPSVGLPRSETTASLANEQVAGKVYEKGRNWTSVVVEIVPSSIVKEKGEEMAEDEDVVEVPVRVRLEWKVTDEQALRDAGASGRKIEDGEVDDGSRELAYWMVLGIGRVG